MSYEQNVFVNCPFDPEYREMMHAIVFSVHDCGLVARSALEISDNSQVRIDRILTLIEECQFGIHDISRTELDPVHQLPRFNMPLELGLFLGAKRFGPGRHAENVVYPQAACAEVGHALAEGRRCCGAERASRPRRPSFRAGLALKSRRGRVPRLSSAFQGLDPERAQKARKGPGRRLGMKARKKATFGERLVESARQAPGGGRAAPRGPPGEGSPTPTSGSLPEAGTPVTRW